MIRQFVLILRSANKRFIEKMSNKKEQNKTGEQVVQAVSKTELFFKEYKNLLMYCGIGIVVIVGIIIGVQQFVIKPKKEEAKSQMFVAEQAFRADNFEVALNGDGNALGFKEIISDYGKKAGKIAWFYAGICELQLGNYESAISYLSKYKTDDLLLQARTYSCIGDAYVGLNDYKKAINHFMQAANLSDNMLAASYLMKAAIIHEEMGNNAEALKLYQQIKDQYPQSYEGYQIDKYITRIKVNL